MQPDRCLHVCLLGDSGTGQSALLHNYQESEGGPQHRASIESLIAKVELEGQPFCVRFTDNVGGQRFDGFRGPALRTAHVVLLCFSVDDPETLENIKRRWLPCLWSSGSEAPYIFVGLRADLRAQSECIDQEEAAAMARRHGSLTYLECSSQYAETVRTVVDEALMAARDFYGLQWQLRSEGNGEPETATWLDGAADADAAWLEHERINVCDDPRSLDAATIKRSLSMLGATTTRQHAYLRVDLADLGLTSLDTVSSYRHLQFVNVSKNHLRTLEPLGTLRCLLHLNASFNLLIRTQSFVAPDALETVDLSYNMIGELGDWGVHKYMRELNLRGNFISRIGLGLRRNKELRMLDLSENNLGRIENVEGLGLRTFYAAQNRLTSLEGIGSLAKLQVLNVRHNNITSIAHLRATEVPRLGRLCVSDNCIARIQEVEGLENFALLCDLLLSPNPMVELPHYRAQVLHRLPCLRSLDGQPIPPEEKAKAALIYGADVEARKKIFEDLVPKEQFVDRRLVTDEGIKAMELREFGTCGDAGPNGRFLEPVEDALRRGDAPPPRTRHQEAKLQQRLEVARRGGTPPGVADFVGPPAPFLHAEVEDDDLQDVLEAAAQGGVKELLLGAARLSADGVRKVLAQLQDAEGKLRHVDLAGCRAVRHLGPELVQDFPFSRGCSLEVSGCDLPNEDVEELRKNYAGAVCCE